MTSTEDHTRRTDDQPARQQLEWDSDEKLIDAALAHLASERAACALIGIPGTEPQQYVAVGTVPAVGQLLQQARLAASAQLAEMLEQYRNGERGLPTYEELTALATISPQVADMADGETRAAFELTEQGSDLSKAFAFGAEGEYANPAVQNRWVGYQRAIAAFRRTAGGEKPEYGPNNPPRLRKPDESVEAYRIAMGWDQPKSAIPTPSSAGQAGKTALQVIDEYLHPRVPADLRSVGTFVYEGVAWVATSSDDPRGVKLYGSPSEAQAGRAAHQPSAQDVEQAGRFDRVTPQEDGSFQHSYRGKPVPGTTGRTEGGAA